MVGAEPNSEIPISRVDLSDSIALVEKIIKSGSIAQGSMVAQLEETFAELNSQKYAVAVNNGTSALLLALKSMSLEPEDEVLTSPFTFGATLNSILFAGATARFAEINEDDFGLDMKKIESFVSPKTRVLMPVHLYGQMCDMSSLRELADLRNLHVIEDAAQATFSSYQGRNSGTWGVGCFSFYATKNFTSGEGGIISTNDEDIFQKLKVLRNQGMKSRYEYVTSSLNFRMTDIQAALLMPQLLKRDSIRDARALNAQQMSLLLSEGNYLLLPEQLPFRVHTWHQYTILIKSQAPFERNEVVKKMNERGIAAMVYYPKLVFDYDCFKENPRVILGEFPVAKSISERCFSIPIHQHLTQYELKRIANTLLEICSE